jgi:glutamyl-tRNA synthetase
VPTLQTVIRALRPISDAGFTEEALKAVLAGLKVSDGLEGSAIMTPLRFALTGALSGPGVTAIMAVLGKAEVFSRLEMACG